MPNPLPYTRPQRGVDVQDVDVSLHIENMPLFRREFCCACPIRQCSSWCLKLEEAWANAAWQAVMDQRRLWGELD